MGLQKLPVIGTAFQNQPAIPGLSGVNALTGATVAPPTNEISITRFLLSGATITLDGTNATVTLASHLNTIVGQQVTFSGATGVTAINNQTWTIGSIPTSGTYTFPCTLTGTVTGTIVQEPVFTLPQGFHMIRLAANAIIEYNPDNLYVNAAGSATAPTWRTLNAASTNAFVGSDGFAVRMRCSGTTATTTWSIFN